MKKNVFVFVLLIALAVSVSGQNASDFDYTEKDGKITITFYKGTVTNVRIPEKINGKPVVAIGENAFAQRLSSQASKVTSVIIPDSVTLIGNYAFGYSELTSVTFGNGDIEILGAAFYRTQLTNVTFGNGNTVIGYGAFEFTPLTNITFGNGITTIMNKAFSDTKLTILNLPKNVTRIDGNPVSGRDSVCTAINVDPANPAYSSVNGVVYNKAQTALIAYPSGKTDASFAIPVGVTSIGTFAFSNSSLSSITVPNGVTSIGESAFVRCTNLASITIPNSVTSIGELAFFHCTNLTSITIPNSVTSIGFAAFENCTYLTSVTFQGKIAANNLGSNMSNGTFESPFDGDLRAKYLAGGPGTYIRTTPLPENKDNLWGWKAVWIKQ